MGEIVMPTLCVIVIVIVAEADIAVLAAEVAVSVIVPACVGNVAGAMYVVAAPLVVLAGEIVPHPGEQAATPCVSVQVTPVLGVPATMAINAWVWPAGTFAAVGDTVTVIVGVCEVVAAQPIRHEGRQSRANKSNIRRMNDLTVDRGMEFFSINKACYQNQRNRGRRSLVRRGRDKNKNIHGNLDTNPGASAIRKRPQFSGGTGGKKEISQSDSRLVQVSPVRTDADFHHNRDRKLVNPLHLFLHQFLQF